jgi:rhomboid protease GluP
MVVRNWNRKAGNRLSYHTNYLYWKFIHSMIVDGYRIMHLAEDQQEVWLENIVHKQFPLIRVKRKDIDWSNWLRSDMKQTILQADKIRKMYFRNKFQVLNIYFTSLPPVDSYEPYVNRPVQIENVKTKMYSILFDESHLQDSVQFVTKIIGQNPFGQIKEDYSDYEVDALKSLIAQETIAAEKREKQLFNRTKPFFTYFLLVAITFVFILLEMNGGSTNPYVLLYFGAKYNPAILDGEWWRFFTPMFLHIGFLHLFMNGLSLYYLGTAVESIFGRLRFLIIYLFSGFFGTLASFIFSSHLSAGASGAIFGLFGALLYFGIEHKHTFFRTIGPNILALIGVNVVIGFAVPSIDISGHMGGMIGGFLAAGILGLPDTKKRYRMYYLLLTVVITAIALYYGYQFPNI